MPTPIVQRCLILLCGGLLIVLFGAAPAQAQFPGLPATDQPVPAAAQETLDALQDAPGLTINTAEGCCKPSIWDFLGVHEVHEHLHETLVSIGELPLFAGLQQAIMLPALQMVGLAPPSAGGLPVPGADGAAAGPTPAAGAGAGAAGPGGAPSTAAVAAQIQADEAEADAKIELIEILAKEDCNRYPEIVPALLADLDHPVERVRYAVLLALQKQCGELRCSTLTGTRILFKMHHRQFMPVCRQCTSCACQQQVIKRLSDLLLDRNALGHPKEQSPRVRQLAAVILERCMQMHPPDPATPPPPALEDVQPDPVPPPLPDPVLFPAPPAAESSPIQQIGHEVSPRREVKPRRKGPSAFLKKIFRWPGRSKFETSLVLPEADLITPGTIVRAQNLDLASPADPFMPAGGWRNAGDSAEAVQADGTGTTAVAGWQALPSTGMEPAEPQSAIVETPLLPEATTRVTATADDSADEAASAEPAAIEPDPSVAVDAPVPVNDAALTIADLEEQVRHAARSANELFPHRNGARQHEFLAAVETLAQCRLELAIRGYETQGEKLFAEASGLCRRDPGSAASAVVMETLSRYLQWKADQPGPGQAEAMQKYAACLRYMAAHFDSPAETTATRLLEVARSLESAGDRRNARTAREHVVQYFPHSTFAASAQQDLAASTSTQTGSTRKQSAEIVPVAYEQAEREPTSTTQAAAPSITRQAAAARGGRVIANQPVELPPLPDAAPVPTKAETVPQPTTSLVPQPIRTETVQPAPMPALQQPLPPTEQPQRPEPSEPAWTTSPEPRPATKSTVLPRTEGSRTQTTQTEQTTDQPRAATTPSAPPVLPEPARIEEADVAPIVVKPERARSRPRGDIAVAEVAEPPVRLVLPEPVDEPARSARQIEEEPHVEPQPKIVGAGHVQLEMAPLPGIEGPRSQPAGPLRPVQTAGPVFEQPPANHPAATTPLPSTQAAEPKPTVASAVKPQPTPVLPAGTHADELSAEIVAAGALTSPSASLLAVPADFQAALESSPEPDLVTAGYVEPAGTVQESYFEPVPLPNEVYDRARQALEANYEAEFYVQDTDDILDRFNNTVGIQLAPHALFEIDPARPTNMNRLRFKSMIGYKLPDRSEYLWSKIGGRGPKQTEFQLDIHQFTIYSEKGSDTTSAFFEIPITMLDPAVNSNTAGPGDMVIGAKTVMLEDENWIITSLMRTYTPLGTPRRGLGRGHLALEPGVTIQWRFGRRTHLHGTMKFHFPIAANFDFGGEVLITGLGFTRVLLSDPVSPPIGRSWALVLTSETIVTSFLDGLMTLPNGAVVDGEGSVAVQNVGLRYIWTERFSTGFSMGVPISDVELFDLSMLTEFQWVY
ncbi:hypothetical protein Mal4_56010 [Maioricimonas rarisocia]|uniref:Uncharacterized protein n=1 Tax=Maioricimonas rarisocia TaxID=2528026 RepID=A0A517ZFI3_9PLAN|nr:hypothetical protein [Maioricimonas rarisocia]QDU41236.1 hypothetical protein Mal4_56010 [Maioricimonas rarisocia]